MPDPNREILVVYRDWTEKVGRSLAYELNCEQGIISTVRNADWGYWPSQYLAVVCLSKDDYKSDQNVTFFPPDPFVRDKDALIKRTPGQHYDKQASEIAQKVLNWLG